MVIVRRLGTDSLTARVVTNGSLITPESGIGSFVTYNGVDLADRHGLVRALTSSPDSAWPKSSPRSCARVRRPCTSGRDGEPGDLGF
jgi:hypothetical protein